MQDIVDCLTRVAEALNARHVRWALGASMLLYCHGIVPRANDLDIVALPEDMPLLDAALSGLSARGGRLPPSPSPGFATRFFYEYEIGGVFVDAMAGLVVRHTAGETAYTLRPETVTEYPLNGVVVPLSPLEDWYALYLLMGREEKARLLEAYFRAHGADRALLAAWLDNSTPLPEAVRERIKTAISAAGEG